MSDDLTKQLSIAIRNRLDPRLLEECPIPFTGEWSPISPQDSIVLLSKVTRNLIEKGDESPWPLTHEALALRSIPLPFYDNALLFDVVLRHRIGWIGHAGFIVFEDKILTLTTNSTAVHEINHERLLNFETSEDVWVYLQFFSWVVCGDKGPFSIVDKRERLTFCYEDDIDTALQDFFVVGTPKPDSEKPGHWHMKAPVYYNSTAFTAEFLVYPNGLVEMLSDEKKAEFGPGSLSWRLAPPIRYIEKKDG